MGLDITAASKAVLHKTDAEASKLTYDEVDELYDGYTHLWSNMDFADRQDDLEPGYYSVGESMSLHAGSYSGYSHWRNWLAETFMGASAHEVWENRTAYKNRPFYELVDMSDCEGFIGPRTSAKLAKDFQDHRAKIDKISPDDESYPDGYNAAKYREWQAAFEMAADGGVVAFH